MNFNEIQFECDFLFNVPKDVNGKATNDHFTVQFAKKKNVAQGRKIGIVIGAARI